jgi:hypothetical protein
LNSSNDQEGKARKLIYALLITLVFEGIIRKLAPSALSIMIFFLKDVLCLLGLYFIVNTKLSETAQITAKVFKIVIILMYPLLLYNLFIDPILIVWGGKLYLLYFVVAILITIAYPPEYGKRFATLSSFLNIIIVAAVSTGFLQLNLPPTHWLNRSVGGESLEHFAAAGQLRISSTFSFTGQYSFFLVFASALFCSLFFLTFNNKKKTGYYLLIQIGIVLLLLMGGFSTGGRTAVLGIFSILGIALLLMGLNNPFFALKKLILPVLLFLFAFPLVQIWKPEYFVAYTERSSGTKNDGVFARVLEPFSGLRNSSMIGNGLGVMTNGSDKVSRYAESIRSTGIWTESDFSTIIWEGGYYLILVWYGFRLFVILYSLKILRSIKDKNNYCAASFLLAYIIVQGLIGTLTLQPPIAIYFWICFGTLICIQKFDEYDQRKLILES